MADAAGDVPSGAPGSRPRERIAGVDAARAVALIGMIATHLLPVERRGQPTLTGLLFDGRASALFAVLAGVGVALSTGGRRRPVDARAHAAAGAGLLVQAVLIGLLGLALADLDPIPLVILSYYALLFVVAVPVLRMPAGVLAVGAVVFCAGAPVLSQLLRSGPALPVQVGFAALGDPGQLFRTLALTGVYPALTWTTYLLAGLAAGRSDLRRTGVAAGLLVGGAALSTAASLVSTQLLGPGGGAFAIGARALAEPRYGSTPTSTWWWLAVDLPHSGAPLDLARTTGSALAVLGGMLLLQRLLRGPVRWASWLLAAMGGAPLTLYTAHVLATLPGTDGSVRVFLAHLALVAVIGVAVRLRGGRGPLEAVVGAASRRVAGMVARRPARPAGPA